jgi:hypothetical protein
MRSIIEVLEIPEEQVCIDISIRKKQWIEFLEMFRYSIPGLYENTIDVIKNVLLQLKVDSSVNFSI